MNYKTFINTKYRSPDNLLAVTTIPSQTHKIDKHTTYKFFEITNMYIVYVVLRIIKLVNVNKYFFFKRVKYKYLFLFV